MLILQEQIQRQGQKRRVLFLLTVPGHEQQKEDNQQVPGIKIPGKKIPKKAQSTVTTVFLPTRLAAGGMNRGSGPPVATLLGLFPAFGWRW